MNENEFHFWIWEKFGSTYQNYWTISYRETRLKLSYKYHGTFKHGLNFEDFEKRKHNFTNMFLI